MFGFQPGADPSLPADNASRHIWNGCSYKDLHLVLEIVVRRDDRNPLAILEADARAVHVMKTSYGGDYRMGCIVGGYHDSQGR